MPVRKKSLISQRNAVKKALVAKANKQKATHHVIPKMSPKVAGQKRP